MSLLYFTNNIRDLHITKLSLCFYFLDPLIHKTSDLIRLKECLAHNQRISVHCMLFAPARRVSKLVMLKIVQLLCRCRDVTEHKGAKGSMFDINYSFVVGSFVILIALV